MMQSQTDGEKPQEPKMTSDGGYSIGCEQCIKNGHAFVAMAGTRWGVTEALKHHISMRHDSSGH